MGENMLGAVRGFAKHLAKQQDEVPDGSDVDSVFFDLSGFKMVRGAFHTV